MVAPDHNTRHHSALLIPGQVRGGEQQQFDNPNTDPCFNTTQPKTAQPTVQAWQSRFTKRPKQMTPPQPKPPKPSNQTIRQRARREKLVTQVTESKRKRMRQMKLYQKPRTVADNLPYGDNIHENKEEGHCRICCNNINGLPSDKKYAKIHEIGEAMVDYDIDLQGLLEVKRNFHNAKVRETCKSKFRQYFSVSQFTTASIYPKDPSTDYLPGGIATMVGDPWVSRASATEVDKLLSRWICTTFQGKKRNICDYYHGIPNM